MPLLAGIPGVVSMRFGRGVEHPDKFLLSSSGTAWTRTRFLAGAGLG